MLNKNKDEDFAFKYATKDATIEKDAIVANIGVAPELMSGNESWSASSVYLEMIKDYFLI